MGESASLPNNAFALQWFLGGIVVVLYARDRFRNPRPMRATTTFWRYWSAWVGYIVAMVALFILLGGGFTAVDASSIFKFLGGSDVSKETSAVQGPLLSALLLTSLLPHFPVLGKIDEAVKEWFQRVGNMPFEVRELSAHLRDASHEPSPDVLERLLPMLCALHIDPLWRREPSGTVKRRWTRCATLYAQVQRWEDARGYSRYVDENKVGLADIRNRVSALAEILDVRMLDELDRDSDSALVVHMRKKIGSELSALHRALCDFISGGVLNGGWNHHQRHAALTRMGFTDLPATRAPLSANDIVLVMGLVFLALLFIPLMLRRFVDPVPLGGRARILVMVPIIYAIAIVAAIYPKSVWPFAGRRHHVHRPVAAYALSGLAATAAAFAVSVLFRFAFGPQGNVFQAMAAPGAFANALAQSVERWPWLLMTFFATVAIAWAADDRSSASLPARTLRWLEAAALAGIFGILQWTVLRLLQADGTAAYLSRSLPSMLATAATIGACIGWYVPHLYRSQARRMALGASVNNAAEAPGDAPPSLPHSTNVVGRPVP